MEAGRLYPDNGQQELFENEILAKLDDHDREFVLDKFWLCAMVKNEESWKNILLLMYRPGR